MNRDSRQLRVPGSQSNSYFNGEEVANPFGTGKRGVPMTTPTGTYAERESVAAQPTVRNPERPLKYNPTGKYDRIPDDLKQFESTISGIDGITQEIDLMETLVLVPCPHCGRKFAEERLEKHSTACQKLLEGKARRGAFNTSTSPYGSSSPSLNSSHNMSSSAKSLSSPAAASPLKKSTTTAHSTSVSSPSAPRTGTTATTTTRAAVGTRATPLRTPAAGSTNTGTASRR